MMVIPQDQLYDILKVLDRFPGVFLITISLPLHKVMFFSFDKTMSSNRLSLTLRQLPHPWMFVTVFSSGFHQEIQICLKLF